jgi:stage III sporulation protein AC
MPNGENKLTKTWRKGKGIIMDVDLIFKIAAIGIIVAVLNQLLIRSGREEQAMLTTLAGLIVVLSMIVGQISELFQTVKSVFGL